MRLGQLARKYDIPVQEIIEFLEVETGERFHANAKLFDTLESRIFDHFELVEEKPLEPSTTEIEKPVAQDSVTKQEPAQEMKNEPVMSEEVNPLPATPEEEIAFVEGDIILSQGLEELEFEEITESHVAEEKVIPSDDEIIQTDKLLEMLDSEDDTSNLDKIKLIKAPKKELSGLKVVGKIDLPEPKKKPDEKNEKSASQNGHNRKPKLSEEEKEKRRLKAKKKKEAYEARKAKRQKQQEANRRKKLKEAHYQQNLQKVEIKKQKRKERSTPTPGAISEVKEAPKPIPKTWLGKWWRWMNT